MVILCILSFIRYTVFRPCLKEYNPQTAKRRKGEHYSKLQARELNKHYANYFSLTQEAKRTLATTLGIKTGSLRLWMHRKWRQEKDSKRIRLHLQTLCQQERGINVAGIRITAFHLQL